MSFKTLLVLAGIPFTLSSPLLAGRSDAAPLEDYTKEGLSNEFKGLYWDYAFQKDPESGKQECTKDMLDILVPGLRKTKEFTRLLTDPNRKDFNTDGAWHTFYIRPNPEGKTIVKKDWNYNDEYKGALKAINENAKIASIFPFDGGSGSKAQRASIRCKDALPDGETPCANNPQLPAYTTQREGKGGTGDNIWITLCPKFFAKNDIPNLADVTNNKKKSSELYTLRTREHVIAHEFMHVKRYGYRNFIDDLSDARVDGKVYGGSRCADFGWLFLKASDSKVNVLQEINADTYAWWFTAVWFQTKWGWPYDTKSTDRPGWTDANGVQNGFDDRTKDDGGVGGDPGDFLWTLDHKDGGISGTTGG